VRQTVIKKEELSEDVGREIKWMGLVVDPAPVAKARAPGPGPGALGPGLWPNQGTPASLLPSVYFLFIIIFILPEPSNETEVF
jgi:hypothetical protein